MGVFTLEGKRFLPLGSASQQGLYPIPNTKCLCLNPMVTFTGVSIVGHGIEPAVGAILAVGTFRCCIRHDSGTTDMVSTGNSHY